MVRLFTIGFTKKKTREFFGLLSGSGPAAARQRPGSGTVRSSQNGEARRPRVLPQ